MEKFYTQIEIHDKYAKVRVNGEVYTWSGNNIYYEVNDEMVYDLVVDDEIKFSSPTWCTFVICIDD